MFTPQFNAELLRTTPSSPSLCIYASKCAPHTKDTIHFLSHTNKPCSFHTKRLTLPSFTAFVTSFMVMNLSTTLCVPYTKIPILHHHFLLPINSFADCIMILLALRSFMDTTKSTHKMKHPGRKCGKGNNYQQ